ncbi:MAG: S41 family peptidase [Alphaproteobacteria bacterium]
MKKFIIIFFLFPYYAFASNLEIINGIYKIFDEEYIEKNIIENLSINTLKSLKIIDNNISISNDDKNIGMYYKTKKITHFNKPQNNDYKQWAELTNKIINKAIETSPVLQKKHLEVVDLLFTNSINDKNNKFYPNIKIKDSLSKHKKTFSSNIDKNFTLTIVAKNINQITYNSIQTVINNNPKAKKLVLDLRNNNGGDFKSAVDIINLFIDEGVIFTTKDRNKNTKIFQAKSGDIFEYKPIYILVNEQTASSAELIAFVMQNQDRAQIAGTPTYGKNSVQTLFLIQGRGVGITTEYFYDINGNNVKIIPQIQQIP